MADDAVQNAQEVFSGTREVDERHRFDEGRLAEWMQANVQGYAGPLTVRQFKGGQSNPTYELTTPGQTYVLRKKPPGKLLPSAHAVDREFKVISALGSVGFPLPKAYALCTDDDVLGTMFYVMEKVDGRILWNLSIPGESNDHRRAIYLDQVDVLAQMHNADYQAIGLGDYGKPGNYFQRQISRWTKQYKASETEYVDSFEKLIEYLPATAPDDDRTSVVHGDFRLDNMVLHPTEPKVIAVLDWELSTLGNPMADFSYYLMQWSMGGDSGRPGLLDINRPALGIPEVPELVERYCRATHRSEAPNMDWYFAYNLFRLAGIVQGIEGRVRDGTAASAEAEKNIGRARNLSDRAWEFAKRAGATG